MNPKTMLRSKHRRFAVIACGVLVVCSISIFCRVCSFISRLRNWQPNHAEVVAAIIDGNWKVRWIQYDSHRTSWLVTSESAKLLTQVKTLKWISEDSVDLVDLAAKAGEKSIYIGEVEIVHRSSYLLYVNIGTWPIQVAGDEKILFLSGGSSSYSIRPKTDWLLFGKGPKYEIQFFGEVIS